MPQRDNGIEQEIADRGISEVVHFSTNLGFLGALAKDALMPRNRLSSDDYLEHILTLNAPFRTEEQPWFDKTQNWIDYVNLSISEITINLFKHSLRWHAGSDIFWLIMSFDPMLMADPGVYFSTTNCIYPLTSRKEGSNGLKALFAPVVQRKPGWSVARDSRPPELPTCEQAEVLYPKGLTLDRLRKVYCRQGEDCDRVYSMLSTYDRKTVEVVLNEEKFKGRPN
jgi:hypothetical protein